MRPETINTMLKRRAGRLRVYVGLSLVLAALFMVSFSYISQLAQDRAAKEVQRALASSLEIVKEDSDPEQSDPGEPSGREYEIEVPRYSEGDPVGRIVSENKEIEAFFVMGTTEKSLSKGPGVFYGGPLPGQDGNTAIAGHRTSHGAPFKNIDKLKIGSSVLVETEYGTFKYVVTGSEIINPRDVRVLSDTTGADLTLIACHPLHSTKQRIVVTAQLKGSL